MFKSKKQREQLKKLVDEGKFSAKTFQEWDQKTNLKDIPTKAVYKPKGLTRGLRKTR